MEHDDRDVNTKLQERAALDLERITTELDAWIRKYGAEGGLASRVVYDEDAESIEAARTLLDAVGVLLAPGLYQTTLSRLARGRRI